MDYINQGNGTHEHQVIAERLLGRKLKSPEEVHHIDGNGMNNALNNLVICPNRAYHALLHIRTEAYDACGNANYRRCIHCGKWDVPSNMKLHAKSFLHRLCRNERARNYHRSIK